MKAVTEPNMVSATAPLEHADTAPGRVSNRLARTTLVLCTLLACLGMLELGLRLIGRYRLDSIDSYFAQEGFSYGLKKNATKRVFWPTMSFIVHTDQFGFRAETPGPRTIGDKPYYAILGASEVFGNGLDYQDTFIGVFADKMKSHNIDVVNLAVQGHHLLEQTARFKEFTASAKRPPAAVVVNLNPLFIGGYDDINPNVIVRRGQLFEKDDWRIPLLKMMLSNSSAAFCFFRDGIRKIQLNYFGRPDFSLDFYLTRYSTQHRIRNPQKTDDFLKRLGELEDHIRSLGAIPIFVYIPTSGGFLLDKLKAEGALDGSKFDTRFFEELAQKHSEATGIKFVDFEPMLQARYDRGEKLNFDLDAHFNGPTSRAMGEYLYHALKPEPVTTQP